MKEIILVKNGEIALKGLNRGTFEDMLIQNIKRRLRSLGDFSYRKAQSTIYITPTSEGIDLEAAVERLGKVFGIAAISRAAVVEKDFDAIRKAAIEYLSDALADVSTFKVEAKRSDKQFPMNSPEIMRELGGYILDKFPHLSVDVHRPQLTVIVEVRDFGAYIHSTPIPGAGGMPAGSAGQAMLLLSGGIDSPVAGYMMAKRGLSLGAIHFVSPPYTSDRALQKVETLAEELCDYCGKIDLYVVPFTELQEALRDHCPEELFTILMRRMMMRIADRIAKENDMQALVTGESVAQVASQTLPALVCTDIVAEMPVFRPVIGMDKSDIIAIAQKIGTFETSILPYEDCCTVFTPKHPRTKPKLESVEAAECQFDFAPLLEAAIRETERKTITRVD